MGFAGIFVVARAPVYHFTAAAGTPQAWIFTHLKCDVSECLHVLHFLNGNLTEDPSNLLVLIGNHGIIEIQTDGRHFRVSAAEVVEHHAAVEEMREYLGDYGDIMNDYAGEGNTENPLPASFRVSVTDVADLAPTVERIKAMGAYTATAEDGTASDANVFYKVNSPSELSSTLVNLKRIVNYIGWGLVAVLGVVSVVVISNTIRLTVFARRKEINIMKFVGATNAFIRLPFFVEGMTVGAISGVLATVVVGGAYYGLEQALLQPEALWLNEFTKCMWPFMDIIWPLLGGFVLFGVAIGGVGCASSIRKHLKV